MRLTWQSMSIDEKSKFVKAAIADGKSASQIAALVSGASRNAIIGFVHRQEISLPGATKSASKIAGAKRRKQQAKKAPPRQPAPVKAAPEPQQEASPADVSPVPDERATPAPATEGPVDLLHLTDNTCRWPLNTSYLKLAPEEMMFCGKPPRADGPYCSDCRELSFAGYARRGAIAVDDNGEPKKTERKRRPFLRWAR